MCSMSKIQYELILLVIVSLVLNSSILALKLSYCITTENYNDAQKGLINMFFVSHYQLLAIKQAENQYLEPHKQLRWKSWCQNSKECIL